MAIGVSMLAECSLTILRLLNLCDKSAGVDSHDLTRANAWATVIVVELYAAQLVTGIPAGIMARFLGLAARAPISYGAGATASGNV